MKGFEANPAIRAIFCYAALHKRMLLLSGLGHFRLIALQFKTENLRYSFL